MRAAWYERKGDAADVLVVGDVPDPAPAAGEVRVRLHVSGVNPSDVKSRSPRFTEVMPFPRVIPHSDGAGVIDAAGPDVDPSRIGQRVWTWNAAYERPFGTAAEYVTLPAEQAVPLPDAVDDEAGACIGIPLLTAYRAVTLDGPLAGETILVTGGAGAVGHYAIQLASRLGARVLTTVSSPEKAAHAEAAGADATVDYRREDVAARVRALTGGRGVDRIIEVDLAGYAPLYPALLRKGGTAVVYGTNEPQATIPANAFIRNSTTLRVFIVYDLPTGARREAERTLDGILRSGRLVHTIAARYPLERIADAHEAVERGTTIGNVVVTL